MNSSNIVRQLEIIENCEDYIFRKMHIWAYNKVITYETTLLEQMYMDLSDLFLVVLAEKA